MSVNTVNQDRAYFDLINPKYISWEFYSQYLKKQPPFGIIGDIVDCRTYRRFIPQFNRRERAVEAFLRVVEYNIALASGLQMLTDLVKEAELMFDNLFNLKVLPSNRSRWTGGTESVKKHPASIFNCAFTAINRLSAFGDLFELLCLGTGVGFRVFKRDIHQLPDIRNKKLEIEFKEYKPVPKSQRLEHTSISYPTEENGLTSIIKVGDSREGWRTAIEQLISCFTNRIHKKLIFNFDSVRPFGERILGFGGKASGYQALQGILQEIHKIVTECPEDKLRSIDCMDIACCTARGVIAGSSRRSALICLFDEDDDLCRNAKTDWRLLEETGKTYRSQSNNTCCIGSIYYAEFIKLLEADPTEDQVLDFLERVKPKKSFFDNAFGVMKVLGEPALDHYLLMVYKRYLAARKYRPDEDWHKYVDVATNPCHEINGTVGIDGYSGGFCNLSTNDLTKCVKYDSFTQSYYFDYVECQELVELMVRISLRQTEVTIPMSGWNETQRKERLLGIDAVNGFQNAIALLGWKYNDENSSKLRKLIREWANNEADRYSAKLGIERPLLVTCVKPNGNTGAVLGVSSGIHWDWDEYYMRRVTMNAQDSLAKTLLNQGLMAYPSNNDSSLGTVLQKMYFNNLDNLSKSSILADVDTSQVSSNFITAEDLIDLGILQFPIQTLLDYFITLDPVTRKEILNKCNNIVFEFPVHNPGVTPAGKIPVLDQLENLRLFSTEYTDHLPSVTITVKDNEWEDVSNWVFNNWNNGFITASFLSYFNSSYPLLAYQSISQETYNMELKKLLDNSTGTQLLDNSNGNKVMFSLNELLLNYYESGKDLEDEEDLKVDNCTTGCPIK